MKLSLLAAGLLLAGTTAQAQVRFSVGPQVGYTLATTAYQMASEVEPYNTYSVQYKSGVAAGLVAEIGLGHFAIQPAVQFAQKGFGKTEDYNDPYSRGLYQATTDGYVRFNYLTIPLNFVYAQQANGQGFQLFAGPYVGILLNGRYSRDVTSTNVDKTFHTIDAGDVIIGNTYSASLRTSDAYARKIDGGLQFGVGYSVQRVLAQAGYSIGLRNLAPTQEYSAALVNYSPPPTFRNRAFQFSLAYLFGPNS